MTGQKIVAVGGAGGGTVIGQQVQVTAGADPASDLVKELREAATAVREDKGHKSWIHGLLKRVGSLADRAVDATVLDAAHQAAKIVFGG